MSLVIEDRRPFCDCGNREDFAWRLTAGKFRLVCLHCNKQQPDRED